MSEPPHGGEPARPGLPEGTEDRDWTTDRDELAAARPDAAIRTPRLGIEAHRETTRGQLAKWLMGLLTITVLTILLLAGLQLAGIVGPARISIRDLAQITLTPVVTLTGTALGFYFGAQTATSNGSEPEMPAPRPPGSLRRLMQRIW